MMFVNMYLGEIIILEFLMYEITYIATMQKDLLISEEQEIKMFC